MALPNPVSIPEFSLEEFQAFAAAQDGFWELHEGVPVRMESASEEHQWISLEIAVAFRAYMKGRKCRSPQLVVEIWSPTNTNKEFRNKLKEYYRIGVKEYWQIDYGEPGFTILSFADGGIRFLSDGDDFHKPLESEYFPGLKVDLSEYYIRFADTAAIEQ